MIGQDAMNSKEFQIRLEKMYEIGGVKFGRLRHMMAAEGDFAAAMDQYRGYAALIDASKCHFLEAVERFNLEIQPCVAEPVASSHAMFVEKLVYIFQSLRVAEIAARNGYPMHGVTLLRNAYDNAVLTSSVLLGLTTFTALAGVRPNEPFEPRKAKRNRKEQRVRRKMDGRDSGLSSDTQSILQTFGEIYDAETHGGQVSQSYTFNWLKGSEPLPVAPSFSERKASLFLNRHIEVAWMAHRLLPSLQFPGHHLAFAWATKWDAIDDSFRVMSMAATEQLGKPFGAAVCEFVRSKFPFDSKAEFPMDRKL
jgi:hypothetical protein